MWPAAGECRRRNRPRSASWGSTFAEPVQLLEVRVAREHELVDADRGVLGDAVGDLGVAADQRGPGAAADQPDAGPQVRRHFQASGRRARSRRRGWPSAGRASLLPGGFAVRPARPGRPRRPRRAEALRLPAQAFDVPRDHVQADAEADRATTLGGEPPDPGDLLGDGSGRLAPGQVHTSLCVAATGPAAGGRRSTAAAPIRQGGQAGRVDVEVPSPQRDGLAGPQATHDGQGARRTGRSARPWTGDHRRSAARGLRHRSRR